jgi:hypothetical protein
MARGIQSGERRQVDPLELLLSAKRDGFGHQTVAQAETLIRRIKNKPAQARPHSLRIAPIYENPADDFALCLRKPGSIVRRIKAAEKSG